MAKCIRHYAKDEYLRVKDEKADELVKTGYWHFVSKSAWKRFVKVGR